MWFGGCCYEPGSGLEAGDAAGIAGDHLDEGGFERRTPPQPGPGCGGVCAVLAAQVYPERARPLTRAVPASPVAGDADPVIRG